MLTQKVLDRQESVLEYGPRIVECLRGHEFTIITTPDRSKPSRSRNARRDDPLSELLKPDPSVSPAPERPRSTRASAEERLPRIRVSVPRSRTRVFRELEIQRCWRCSARKEVWITLEVGDERE